MMQIDSEVERAIDAGGPVVALESTLVAHGLPYPDNLELARQLEDAVREGGAVPATIAVTGGTIRVGLDDAALEHLAEDGHVYGKAGAVDLSVAVALGRPAATTVSATSLVCGRVGIRLFATGGIGGVHRGGAGDVSNDLVTLAREPICVVSAGAKAILDLPATLERLETLGVPVIGYGTRVFPAFYTRETDLLLDHYAENPDELARVIDAHWRLQMGGVLVANPIPRPAANPRERADSWIIRALDDCAAVHGKALTPALLRRIAELSDGESVRANRALALANARLAAAVAVAYAAL